MVYGLVCSSSWNEIGPNCKLSFFLTKWWSFDIIINKGLKLDPKKKIDFDIRLSS